MCSVVSHNINTCKNLGISAHQCWLIKSLRYINLQLTLFSWVASFKLRSSTRGPETLRVLYNILAGPSTSLDRDLSEFFPGICCSHFSSMGVAAQIASMTTGTTNAFTSCILSKYSLRLLDIFQFLLFCHTDVAVAFLLLQPPLQCPAVSQSQDLCLCLVCWLCKLIILPVICLA